MPQKIEYYIDGDLLKVMTIVKTKEIGDYSVLSELKMETIDGGSYTTIEQTDIELDKEIPDEVFTERFLRK